MRYNVVVRVGLLFNNGRVVKIRLVFFSAIRNITSGYNNLEIRKLWLT